MQDDVCTDSCGSQGKSTRWSRAGFVWRLTVGLLALAAVGNWCPDGGEHQVGSFSHEVKHALAAGEQRYLSSVPQPERLLDSACARTCGNVSVPYPFGFSLECARNSHFQLECRNITGDRESEVEVQPGLWPFLTTASGSFMDNSGTQHLVDSFQVTDVNGTLGTMLINITAIKATSCNGSYNTSTFGNASILLPPDGPYRSSSSNVFFVVGCQSAGQYSASPIQSFGEAGDYESALCGPNSCINQRTYPFCNVYDCCTASMPPLLEIYLVGGGISFLDFSTCGFCSVVYPDSYFSVSPAFFGVGTWGLQLDWALEVNQTQYANCSSVGTMADYACSPQASCAYVGTAGLNGYFCQCTRGGFQGDGYLNGTGCNDIDECSSSDLNDCAEAASCTNAVGSYNCTCPVLMEGDGFRNSSGCTYIDFCADGEPNDCVSSALCTSLNGHYNCTCPTNSKGDGRVHGTGCKSVSHVALIVGLSVAGALLFMAMNGLIIWCLYRKKRKEYLASIFGPTDSSRRDFLREIQSKEGANICKLFTLDELSKATNNFSIDLVLGTGGFGTVYEGTLDDGTKLAIKKAKRDVGGARDDTKQFVNEVTILSQVNHRNLVKLLGCCLETPVPILIYEFIPNGNLQEHLRRPKEAVDRKEGEMDLSGFPPLDWNKRLKIAVGTAEALTYLHSGTSPPIYHRDVKTANILLDNKFHAKVADFGLSKFVPLEATHLSTAIQGTPGYLDPEYFDNYQITDKSDVYSFGVVLLELITSEKPVDLSRHAARDHNLALRCSRLLKHGRLEDIIDPVLGASSDLVMLEIVHAVAQVAMKCVERHREDRPPMVEVLGELQSIARSTRKDPPAKAEEHSRFHKHVRFEDDSSSLVLGMSTNSEEFFFSSNPPSSSSNVLTSGSTHIEQSGLELSGR